MAKHSGRHDIVLSQCEHHHAVQSSEPICTADDIEGSMPTR
eukprot:CAMPEP_0181182972 /NCGR_PEP_ID=MMETSP1096-20121128/8170_1 /TAXON_ID=156174 ORGANISM="Chrysochromulina ericina, Strain CCMP281" /NCGR_SAMPLE_ID=MMETSP1096 /ASSEMBLY_ACC=CAM_ASM_000453 /LENGTH=40 /DNA_ID= /DNA_START= /DNA_END= /DNA_ORIENTATION=